MEWAQEVSLLRSQLGLHQLHGADSQNQWIVVSGKHLLLKLRTRQLKLPQHCCSFPSCLIQTEGRLRDTGTIHPREHWLYRTSAAPR